MRVKKYAARVVSEIQTATCCCLDNGMREKIDLFRQRSNELLDYVPIGRVIPTKIIRLIVLLDISQSYIGPNEQSTENAMRFSITSVFGAILLTLYTPIVFIFYIHTNIQQFVPNIQEWRLFVSFYKLGATVRKSQWTRTYDEIMTNPSII